MKFAVCEWIWVVGINELASWFSPNAFLDFKLIALNSCSELTKCLKWKKIEAERLDVYS